MAFSVIFSYCAP